MASKSGRSKFGNVLLAAVAAAALWAAPLGAQTTLRAAMHAGVGNLDPIWTTANIVAYHGALVYDMLFGVDAEDRPQPQMVDTYTLSDDKLTWRFRLRPGLAFSDGAPVTARDCVASIKRWAARDAAGTKLMEKTASLLAVDDQTFELKLKTPYGLVLESFAKNGTPLLFIMRERDAQTDPNVQIKEVVGSGPFIFKMDEWNPGQKAVYVRNPNYKPRSEPASGLAGGKVARVDRVELLSIPDAQTAHQALIKGEIDFLEIVNLDLLQTLKVPGVTVDLFDTTGYRGTTRMNHLHPPFDNPKARQAMIWLTDQEQYMQAVIGDANYWRTCGSMFSCGSSLESSAGTEWVRGHSVEKARQLFREAGYDGRPVVVLDPTDLAWYHMMAQVTASLLQKAGVNAQLQAMDWATMVQRRTSRSPVADGGWNIFHTGYNGSLIGPVGLLATAASCEKAWFGWPCDAKIEELREAWANASDPAQRRAIMDQLQARNFEAGVLLPVGQWTKPVAYRSNTGGWVKLPEVIAFWNVEKR